jgi:hypothetical protein
VLVIEGKLRILDKQGMLLSELGQCCNVVIVQAYMEVRHVTLLPFGLVGLLDDYDKKYIPETYV